MNRGGYRSRGRGGGSRGNARTRTQPRGLFADGIWHCDCDPRLPAEHFRVKKEGKNQGRWFYTCQKQDRCGFFLWDEDAKPREEAAVLNNSRTEPVPAQEGWDAGRSRKPVQEQQPQGKGLFAGGQHGRVVDDEETASESSPPPQYTAFASAASSSKRSAEEAELSDGDDEFGWALGEQADVLEKRATGAGLQTPQKAQKTGVYATPAATAKRKLPWLEQPTTPATSKGNEGADYFQTPSKPPASATNGNEPETPYVPPTLATKSTPSPPTRHRDALSNPADSTSSLTSEVLNCINASNVKLPPNILSELRSIVTKHDLKAQGTIKGRDISRLAIKAKDAKIAELQARIASLEAEREVERGVQRMRRWERENAENG